jgi:aminoglycoside phosphotransferase (APT) family kinase protein
MRPSGGDAASSPAMKIEDPETCAVRLSDGVPVASLDDYLRRAGLANAPIRVEQFPHGHSNLTYLVRAGGEEWVLRRRPHGQLPRHAHDMAREFRVLSKLWTVYALAPRPLLYCQDEAVIGAPFYLMERRRGVIPRGLAHDIIPPTESATMKSLCRALVQNLVRLHAIDYHSIDLADLGRPEGYLRRQIAGWRRRYEEAQTNRVADLDRIAEWLADNVPPESGASVVHNDFKFDNLLVDPADPTRIVGVLDWEMATIGDPLADLGTSLALWIQADDPDSLRQVWISPASRPDSLTRADLVEAYGACRGAPVTHAIFYYCFGLYKVAVIFQQLYARYRRGETRDRRVARADRTVAALARQAAAAIGTGRL